MKPDDLKDSSAPIEALAETPPVSDPVERELVKTRVAAQLFDRAGDPVMIGRFHMLERIGHGGMGRVYSAYDPDLDRRVALKLVRVSDRSTRVRLLGEAQALARLSHPNVVPVHDVEVIGDEVCIVMEYVRGETLRAWRAAAPRTSREVLQVYRQVGEGLEAAHRAGLVHRDVKPDNAIVGADGRVRVVDFGLARVMVAVVTDGAEPATSVPQAPVTNAAGTPRYMAPEQRTGNPVTPAADQYAFCVSLREALEGEAPWLEPALARGTAVDPAARFASMSELLRLLARDPAAIRRRRIVAAAAAALVASAGVVVGAAWVGRTPHATIEPCSGGAEEIANVWNASMRAALAQRIAGASAYGAAMAPRLMAALDDYASRWAASHRGACLAHRRGEQTNDVLDRRMACLSRSRSALLAAVDVLPRAEGAPVVVATLPGASLAVAALPAIERCDDIDQLLDTTAPPAAIAADVARVDGELSRAAVLIEAGRADEARTISRAALGEARRLAHGPLVARGLLALGRAEMLLEPRTRAIAPLREATGVGLRNRNDALAVEAYARRAWAEGTEDRTREANVLDGLSVIEALAERIPRSGFVRALLYNNVAAVEAAAGHHDRGEAAMQRMLAAAGEVPEPIPVELVQMRNNVALYVADPARRAELLLGGVRALAARLGSEHPMTLDAQFRASQGMEDPAAAEAALGPCCATYERMHPDYADLINRCWFELGWLAYRQGDVDRAARAFASAAAQPAEAERIAISRGYLALARGAPAEAIQAFDELLAMLPQHGSWWSEMFAGDAQLGRGLARRAAGDARSAAADLAAAEARLTPVAQAHPYPYIARRLERVRAARAQRDDVGLRIRR